MRRWVVGFGLHHQLLLSVHQPAFTAGLGRMTINEWEVLIGHTAESGEHPDQTDRCSCSFGRCHRIIGTALHPPTLGDGVFGSSAAMERPSNGFSNDEWALITTPLTHLS